MAKAASTLPLESFRWQALLVAFAALALYAGTLGHGFALDDGLVLSSNAYVQRGFAGIPDILAHDSFHGAIGESENLSGGRYRPLSLVMFAAERALFGPSPRAHHLVNVLLYALSAVVLLRWARRTVFPARPMAALAAALLFAAHPLHTEVVANIKGRDEILSLLFILLTLQSLTAGAQGRGARLAAAGWYALALLSKENGIILLAFAPLALFTFRGVPLGRAIAQCWPLAVVAAAYLALRHGVIGSRFQEVAGVLDNPYVLATPVQRAATVLAVLAAYVRLLAWPHPLTYDYSFAQVPYQDFTDAAPWVGAAILLALLASALRSTVRPGLAGWCAAFFLGTWLLVSGLLFNVGAPMAERFMYQASVPFLLALVALAARMLPRLVPGARSRALLAGSLMAVLLLPMAGATVARSAAWGDEQELLLHDARISQRSARANTYAAIACVRKAQAQRDAQRQRALVDSALMFLARADSIVPDYPPAWLNRGLAYGIIGDLDAAEEAWAHARELDPGSTKLAEYMDWLSDRYHRMGLEAGAAHDLPAAVSALEKATRHGPRKAAAWYDLGGACFTIGDTARARASWERALELDPGHAKAQQGLAALRALARR